MTANLPARTDDENGITLPPAVYDRLRQLADHLNAAIPDDGHYEIARDQLATLHLQLSAAFSDLHLLADDLRQQRDAALSDLTDLQTAVEIGDTDNPYIADLMDMLEENLGENLMQGVYDDLYPLDDATQYEDALDNAVHTLLYLAGLPHTESNRTRARKIAWAFFSHNFGPHTEEVFTDKPALAELLRALWKEDDQP